MTTTKPGDEHPVVECKNCGHVDGIVIPVDEQGRPDPSFLHKCSNCQATQRVQPSEIRKGVVVQSH